MDNNIKNKIVKTLNIKTIDIFLEIGAGNGSLTKEFISLPKFTYLLEIDKEFSTELEKNFYHIKKIKILTENILKLNFKDIFKKEKIRILGNIPYNISSKILFILSKKTNNIKDIHIMVQKEFAAKIIFIKKNSCNGYLSFLVNYTFSHTKLFEIPKTSFFPIPKITSVFLRLKPQKNTIILNKKFIQKNIKILFKNKRKRIKNTIPQLHLLNKYIATELRPEEIKITEYIRIFNLLHIIQFD